MVYLQELEFGLKINEDPDSFAQAIESIDSIKWLDAMKEELKPMDRNGV